MTREIGERGWEVGSFVSSTFFPCIFLNPLSSSPKRLPRFQSVVTNNRVETKGTIMDNK